MKKFFYDHKKILEHDFHSIEEEIEKIKGNIIHKKSNPQDYQTEKKVNNHAVVLDLNSLLHNLDKTIEKNKKQNSQNKETKSNRKYDRKLVESLLILEKNIEENNRKMIERIEKNNEKGKKRLIDRLDSLQKSLSVQQQMIISLLINQQKDSRESMYIEKFNLIEQLEEEDVV